MAGSFEQFERALGELRAQIDRVKRLTQEQGLDRSAEIAELEAQERRLLEEVYANLSPWDQTLIARNPQRPYLLDYVHLLFNDFTELQGDRLYADDGAMVGGPARLDDRWVMVIGQQKGRDAADRHKRNHGYSRPEGYRKALRLMRLAEKFQRPVISLVDTTAADASVGSEERGISEAIARNIRDMFLLRVPIIVAITGEGGSGGALGIGVGDRVLMLEHAVYSVIPPEGCAAILWKDPKRAPEAAAALRVTARSAREMGAVDEIVPEPLGAAHRDKETTARNLKEALSRHLDELCRTDVDTLLDLRYEKFRRLGEYVDPSSNGAG